MWLQKVGKKGSLLGILLGIIIFLQGCLKNDIENNNPDEFLIQDVETIKKYLAENSLDAVIDSTFGVFYKIHKNGEGYKTVSGVEVVAHYQGFTLDGVDFVSTFNGNPVNIILGNLDSFVPNMTSGLSYGLSFMREGDSVTVYLPSKYGFGNNSFENVPPNSILAYNIKLVEIKNLEEEYTVIDEYIAQSNISASIEPDYGIRYVIHRTGNNIFPMPGAIISLHYQGELLDGTVFDSSYDRNSPMEFTYGNSGLIPGFESGVGQLHENDSATIFIPPAYGYQDKTAGDGDIPPNSVLIFGLEILKVSNL